MNMRSHSWMRLLVMWFATNIVAHFKFDDKSILILFLRCFFYLCEVSLRGEWRNYFQWRGHKNDHWTSCVNLWLMVLSLKIIPFRPYIMDRLPNICIYFIRWNKYFDAASKMSHFQKIQTFFELTFILSWLRNAGADNIEM